MRLSPVTARLVPACSTERAPRSLRDSCLYLISDLGRGHRLGDPVRQVSFATVVMGLVKRGDALAGRKAISLYELMRREFQFVPDEVSEVPRRNPFAECVPGL